MLPSPERRTSVRETDLAVTNEYDAIADRLKILYPTLDAAEIRAAVDDALRQFGDARLRMFVPLLVEKLSRDECRRLAQPRRNP